MDEEENIGVGERGIGGGFSFYDDLAISIARIGNIKPTCDEKEASMIQTKIRRVVHEREDREIKKFKWVLKREKAIKYIISHVSCNLLKLLTNLLTKFKIFI